MRQPLDRGPAPAPGTRPPEYVIELWVSEQLRDQLERSGISLAEALRIPGKSAAAPEPDLEAEP
jgi:hypothetical protein